MKVEKVEPKVEPKVEVIAKEVKAVVQPLVTAQVPIQTQQSTFIVNRAPFTQNPMNSLPMLPKQQSLLPPVFP